MKKTAAVLLILLSIAGTVTAQGKTELFGYFESQLIGAEINDEFIHLQSNKLRVDLESALSDRVTFGANFNFITYHGKTRWTSDEEY